MTSHSNSELLEMTTDIVSSFVANNPVPANGLPDLLKSVHDAVVELASDKPTAPPRPDPAVAISKSITPDHIICLEDGRKLKMLKRYLRSRYDLTPDEYRARWGLPSDYPMVAPNYAKKAFSFRQGDWPRSQARRVALFPTNKKGALFGVRPFLFVMNSV